MVPRLLAPACLLALPLLTGCSNESTGTAPIVGCLDQATGRYLTCPGDSRCVDPSTGVEVGCAGAPGVGDLDSGAEPDAGSPFGADSGGAGGFDTGAGGFDTGATADVGGGDTGLGEIPKTLSCEQVFACFDACNGSASCEKQCTDSGTPAALASFSLFTSCSNTQACGVELVAGPTGGYIACVYRFCLSEYQGCFGTLVAGTQSCAQMLTCMNGCQPTDNVCLKACGESGTLAAQLEYFDILACGERSCPGKTGAEWASCVNATCTAELAACNQ
jgi:hypothetical protein